MPVYENFKRKVHKRVVDIEEKFESGFNDFVILNCCNDCFLRLPEFNAEIDIIYHDDKIRDTLFHISFDDSDNDEDIFFRHKNIENSDFSDLLMYYTMLDKNLFS